MTTISADDIREALKRIAAPDGRGNIVSAGLLSDIAINDGEVMFALNASPQHMKAMEQLRVVVENTVKALPGVRRVLVALTSEKPQGQTAAPAAPTRGGAVEGV